MARLGSWSAAMLAVVGATVSLTAEGPALADARLSPVVLELRDCEPMLATEVRRIVGVELRATVIDASRARDGVTLIAATCRGLDVDLSLENQATAKRLERTVAMADAAPSGRARLVALAIAELVVASRQEREEPPERPVPPPPPPEPPGQARATESASLERGEISVAAEAIGTVRAFPGSGLWLLGAGARGFFTLSRPFRLTIEATAEWGKTSRTTGQVAARAMGGALGLGWGFARTWAFLMPWLGARAGVARLTGEPSPDAAAVAGETQSGPWLGPEVGFSATLFPRAAVHATVTISAGAMLLGVRGNVTGDRDVSAVGPWAAMVVGVGLAKP